MPKESECSPREPRELEAASPSPENAGLTVQARPRVHQRSNLVQRMNRPGIDAGHPRSGPKVPSLALAGRLPLRLRESCLSSFRPRRASLGPVVLARETCGRTTCAAGEHSETGLPKSATAAHARYLIHRAVQLLQQMATCAQGVSAMSRRVDGRMASSAIEADLVPGPPQLWRSASGSNRHGPAGAGCGRRPRRSRVAPAIDQM